MSARRSPGAARRLAVLGSLLAVLLLGLGACGGGGDDGGDDTASNDSSGDDTTATTAAAGETPPSAAPAHVSWVAQAQVPQVQVFSEPEGAQPAHTLENPNENGAPLVFLVDGQDTGSDWLPVHLPVRPNGSTGFVRKSDVTLAQNEYRVTIELARRRDRHPRHQRPVIHRPGREPRLHPGDQRGHNPDGRVPAPRHPGRDPGVS
jgi:hypothetical protein